MVGRGFRRGFYFLPFNLSHVGPGMKSKCLHTLSVATRRRRGFLVSRDDYASTGVTVEEASSEASLA